VRRKKLSAAGDLGLSGEKTAELLGVKGTKLREEFSVPQGWQRCNRCNRCKINFSALRISEAYSRYCQLYVFVTNHFFGGGHVRRRNLSPCAGASPESASSSSSAAIRSALDRLRRDVADRRAVKQDQTSLRSPTDRCSAMHDNVRQHRPTGAGPGGGDGGGSANACWFPVIPPLGRAQVVATPRRDVPVPLGQAPLALRTRNWPRFSC